MRKTDGNVSTSHDNLRKHQKRKPFDFVEVVEEEQHNKSTTPRTERLARNLEQKKLSLRKNAQIKLEPKTLRECTSKKPAKRSFNALSSNK